MYRPASYIEQAGDNLRLALLFAAGLLMLAMAALFLRWRAVLVWNRRDRSLAGGHALVLCIRRDDERDGAGGLVAALVLVVDDAIVDVDAISRRLQHARAAGSDRPTADIILEATLHLRSSAFTPA